MLDFRCRREVLFHFMDSFVQLQAGTENSAVCFFKPASYFGGDIVSGESYAVQSDHSCRIAVNDHEWAYVLYDLGHAAHHAQAPIFTNWWIPLMPPMTAWSSTVTWPAAPEKLDMTM